MFTLRLKPAFLPLALCLTLVVTGCGTTNNDSDIEGVPLVQEKITKSLAPLLEAKDRQQLACTAKDPLSTKRPLNDIVFVCPELDVQATLSEMKDAGWRLMSMDIGMDSAESDGTISMPLNITVIKLF